MSADIECRQSMLFISAELPYPANAGGRLNSWKMLDYFSKEYHVSVACPLKYGDEYVQEFKASLPLKNLIVEPVEIPRSAKTLAVSYLKGIPLNVYRTCSAELSLRIAAIANDFDILFLDHYETAQYIPRNYHGKVILHEHNATYLLWDGFANHSDNVVYGLVSWFESKRVKAYEYNAGKRADIIFACQNDIESLVKIGFDRDKCRLHPHGGDDDLLDAPPLKFKQTEQTLLYIGSLNWAPNVEGLLDFIANVWPPLKERYPALKYYIVGADADYRLVGACLNEPDITLTGYVEDLEPYYRRARVFTVPMAYGSGTKIKVLNAMARGLPTITTDVGAAGIPSRNFEDLVIANDNHAMVTGISQLIEDEEKWDTLNANSQRVIHRYYRWSDISRNMKQDIDSVFETERRSVAS